ncbi:MAG TPA: LptF/LptG family permease [Ferruginibacter sp.]|nr:LptF/LptG family permease [Ferruginibacter sp.]HRO07019.1 LptF/LptG family permease [Ferruginibacter sp.]HRO95770.1 LptF/LptG family permease [Ferruginibacter sp.]HRP49221.1 LptF/LptG family permease [Ferruginibacter sp.]
MKKLDKYILGKYLTTFFFSLILFTAIVIVVDISEHTDDFVKSKLPVNRIITDYYFGFIPRIVAMLFPLFIFISVIFFTSKMAGRSEVIAILSSGVSFNRYMRPFMIGGIMMSLLLWLGYQTVVPKANLKWAEFEKNYVKIHSKGGKKSTYLQNIYFRESKDAWVGIKGYDTLSRVGNNFFLQRYADNRLTYNMRASGFRWDSTTREWLFNNVVIREVEGIQEKVTHHHSLHQKMNFQPVDLRKDEYLKDQMTTSELKQFIRKERARGSEMVSSLLVERYNRDAIPVSVFILTIIGSVLASRKVRGGSGIHLAVGVVLSVTYILFSRLSVVFATQGSFSPFLAAWTPNILFGIIAVYLYRKAPK